jgi:hypothetical protein
LKVNSIAAQVWLQRIFDVLVSLASDDGLYAPTNDSVACPDLKAITARTRWRPALRGLELAHRLPTGIRKIEHRRPSVPEASRAGDLRAGALGHAVRQGVGGAFEPSRVGRPLPRNDAEDGANAGFALPLKNAAVSAGRERSARGRAAARPRA